MKKRFSQAEDEYITAHYRFGTARNKNGVFQSLPGKSTQHIANMLGRPKNSIVSRAHKLKNAGKVIKPEPITLPTLRFLRHDPN